MIHEPINDAIANGAAWYVGPGPANSLYITDSKAQAQALADSVNSIGGGNYVKVRSSAEINEWRKAQEEAAP